MKWRTQYPYEKGHTNKPKMTSKQRALTGRAWLEIYSWTANYSDQKKTLDRYIPLPNNLESFDEIEQWRAKHIKTEEKEEKT